VPDFREMIPEAFEMVEKGFVTDHGFCELPFTNAAMLHTCNNPGFFKGTVVGQAVADEWGLRNGIADCERVTNYNDELGSQSDAKNIDAILVFTPWLTRMVLTCLGRYRAYERLAE
jgi:antitoxin FitA